MIFILDVEQSKRSAAEMKKLSDAVRKDDLPTLVKALMEGTDLNAKTADEQTFLYIAACSGYKVFFIPLSLPPFLSLSFHSTSC